MNHSNKKSRSRLITALLVIGATAGGVVLWSHIREAHLHGADHDHASHAASALTLNDGQRWQTDQALRTGMERVRDAASRVLPPAARTVSSDDARQFAASVEQAVGYMIQNCKLEPKADATLHVIITDLMSGAAMLAQNPSSSEATALLTRALQRYPEYFDHPGWPSAAAGEPRS